MTMKAWSLALLLLACLLAVVCAETAAKKSSSAHKTKHHAAAAKSHAHHSSAATTRHAHAHNHKRRVKTELRSSPHAQYCYSYDAPTELQSSHESEDFIAEGSFGTVYRAARYPCGHPEDNSTVALKISFREVSEDTFQRISLILQKLNAADNARKRGFHNIIYTYEYFRLPKLPHQTDSQVAQVMEFWAGEAPEKVAGDLQDAWQRRVLYRAVARQLLDAVGYISNRSISHNDLKTLNVVIGPATHDNPYPLKVVDFDEAVPAGEPFGNTSFTVIYTSPYRASSTRQGIAKVSCNVWGYGMVMYELLCRPRHTPIGLALSVCKAGAGGKMLLDLNSMAPGCSVRANELAGPGAFELLQRSLACDEALRADPATLAGLDFFKPVHDERPIRVRKPRQGGAVPKVGEVVDPLLVQPVRHAELPPMAIQPKLNVEASIPARAKPASKGPVILAPLKAVRQLVQSSSKKGSKKAPSLEASGSSSKKQHAPPPKHKEKNFD